MNRYNIGFWNYVQFGTTDIKSAVTDWKELGINLAMSFEYDPDKHKISDVYLLLDECLKADIKVILCDKRTIFLSLAEKGETEFQKGVKAACSDFAAHPAVFGFHIGDEPNKTQWNYAEKAFLTVKNCAPNLTPFINFLPYYLDDNFESFVGVKRENYKERISEFIQKTGAKLISYDFYGQCNYFDKDTAIDTYFKNLNLFREAAFDNDCIFFTSLLSVGHWGYRVPSEDDLRWQINTAVAHGAKGFFWFFIYERTLDGSYRGSPVDLFWEKTPMYDSLARQNHIFNDYFAAKLSDYELISVEHNLKNYGGTKLFSGNDLLKHISYVINPEPLAISVFQNKTGERCVTIVNLSQDKPSCVKFEFCDAFEKYNQTCWLAPGQLCYFSNTEKI